MTRPTIIGDGPEHDATDDEIAAVLSPEMAAAWAACHDDEDDEQ